jgi:prevent-host-death family protein
MAELGKRRTLLKTKNIWSIEEAKAQFSELVSMLEHGSGYQTITKNGRPVAVVISKEDFDKMHTKKILF